MWDYMCVSNPWSVLNLWIGKSSINLYKCLPKLVSIIFKIGALINEQQPGSDFLPSDFLMQKIKKRLPVKPVETAFIVTKTILIVLL